MMATHSISIRIISINVITTVIITQSRDSRKLRKVCYFLRVSTFYRRRGKRNLISYERRTGDQHIRVSWQTYATKMYPAASDRSPHLAIPTSSLVAASYKQDCIARIRSSGSVPVSIICHCRSDHSSGSVARNCRMFSQSLGSN